MEQNIYSEFSLSIEPVAIHQSRIKSQIQDYTEFHYGKRLELTGIPTKRFTTPRGTKITKLIQKRLLKEGLNKKKIQEKWALFCKDVRRLYGNEVELLCKFQDPTIAGSGIYETGATCYRAGSNNSRSAALFKRWNRGKFLTIERVDGDYKSKDLRNRPRGRVFILYLGKRHLYLSNFYYASGLDQNPHLFIQVLEQLHKTQFTSIRSNVNIEPRNIAPYYKNGNVGTVVTDKKGKALPAWGNRNFIPPKYYKIKCPHCPKSLPPDKYYHSRESMTDYMGCCRDHATMMPALPARCRGCSKEMDADDNQYRYRSGEGGRSQGPWCESCWFDLPVCMCCAMTTPYGNFSPTLDGEEICKKCKKRKQSKGEHCIMCQGVMVNNRKWPARVAGHRACKGCLPEVPKCGHCGEVFKEFLDYIANVARGRSSPSRYGTYRGMEKRWSYCTQCLPEIFPIPNTVPCKELTMTDHILFATYNIDNTKIYTMQQITAPVIAGIDYLLDEEILLEGVML